MDDSIFLHYKHLQAGNICEPGDSNKLLTQLHTFFFSFSGEQPKESFFQLSFHHQICTLFLGLPIYQETQKSTKEGTPIKISLTVKAKFANTRSN